MNTKNILLYIGIPIVIIITVASISIINKKNIPTAMAETKKQVQGKEQVQPTQPLEPIKAAEAGDLIVVNYTGTLENGTKFDSSYDAGKPFGFLLGQGMVIKGWDDGLLGAKRGDKKHLVIPADKAYGAQEIKGSDGKVRIPKNSTLVFDIEVVEVMAKAKVDALIKQRQEAEAAASKTPSMKK